MSSLSIPQSTPLKASSSRSNQSELVADISKSVKEELEGRQFVHPVDFVCSLLNLPMSNHSTILSWPEDLFVQAASYEPYEQKQAVRLLNHLWPSSPGFEPYGAALFQNNEEIGDISKEKPDIAVLFPGVSADTPFWREVIIPGEVKVKQKGHFQICRYLRKVHQNRPGGANYVGFLVADRKLSVYVSNAACILVTEPIELVEENIDQLLSCVKIMEHAERLSKLSLHRLQIHSGQSCEFLNHQVIFAKDSMKGSRTTVWSGTMVLNQEHLPAILKSSWQPKHLLDQERSLVRLIRETHQWGIPCILLSGVRMDDNNDLEQTPCSDSGLVRYREVLVSEDNKYRSDFCIKIDNREDCIRFVAGLSDAARVLFLVWKKSRVHHRDVSIGNIALAPSNFDVDSFLRSKGTKISDTPPNRQPAALLIDWENGRKHLFRRGESQTQTQTKHPLDDAMSGTLPYLSVNMLKITERDSLKDDEELDLLVLSSDGSLPEKQNHHLPIDDLESVYWVLFFACDWKQRKVRHWCDLDRNLSDKDSLIISSDGMMRYSRSFLQAWKKDKHPHLLIMANLLIQLAKTVRKLQDTYGRKGELDMDKSQPDYGSKLIKADEEWEPLFAEFVEKLETAVSELKAPVQ